MLSKRLEAVAERVPQGARVADIGCDHAYLPIALIKRGQVPAAIGCDINKGPLEAARKNAARAGISSEQLALRLGDGLTALAPGEVSVVTLAGMGAGLMAEILAAAPEVVAALARIIVSPNVAPWILRRWAMDHGFAVVAETVVLENDHYYEVIALEPAAAPVVYSETALYFGVTLRTRSDALATAYFAARRENDERLLAAWEPVRTRRAEVAERYDRLSALWREWEEERSCR